MYPVSTYVWHVNVQTGNSLWTKTHICHFVVGSKSPHAYVRKCQWVLITSVTKGSRRTSQLDVSNHEHGQWQCRVKPVLSWKYTRPICLDLYFSSNYSCSLTVSWLHCKFPFHDLTPPCPPPKEIRKKKKFPSNFPPYLPYFVSPCNWKQFFFWPYM